MSNYDIVRMAQQQQVNAERIAEMNNKFNRSEAATQRSFEQSLFSQGNAFNAQEAAKNRNWQEAMSNSAHQREIKDLQAAGLNPILSASGGNGAAVTSGATASSLGAPAGAHAQADTSANAAIASIAGSMFSYMSNLDAMKVSAESAQRIAEVQADAQRYAATVAANASMHNAALSSLTQSGISAAQIKSARDLAEYDFQKNMAYKQADYNYQFDLNEQRTANEERLRLEYPSSMPQAVAGLGFKLANLLTSSKPKVNHQKAVGWSGKW